MESNSYGMSLGQIFSLAFKRWWIIALAVILGGALMFAYTYFFVQPVYTSEARIGIKIPEMNAYNDSMTGQKVARECSDILRSDITLNKAAQALNAEGTGVEYTGANLRSMISTVVDDDTRFFSVRVNNTDPKEAQRICSAVIDAFNVVIKEHNIINSAEGIVLDDATLPTRPTSPNYTTNTLIGAIVGLVVSFFSMFILGFLKDTVDCEDYIISMYGDKIPVLAVIPDANTRNYGYRRYTKRYGYGYGYGYGYNPEQKSDD